MLNKEVEALKRSCFSSQNPGWSPWLGYDCAQECSRFYPQMILPSLSPSSNTCTGDWQIWLITGQPRLTGNTSQSHFDWLCTENPRLRCSFLHVKYPIRVAGFKIFMFLLAFLFVCFIVLLLKRTSQMSSFYVIFSNNQMSSVNSLLTLIIVKVPAFLRNLCFGSVLLRYTSCSFPGPSYGSWVPVTGLFYISSFTECCPLKVWCRESKVNRLFNLFSPCQETLSCEITEQEVKLRNYFENSHTVEHPVCTGSSLSPRTGSVRSELQNTNIETNGSI